ncbi:hypothetical protein CEXT_484471 [Caerostris extrusa]|uniref:Uncharacterized protein n=1 Tax=Caerostris extrusa TaxID=172846 RepID=A0AAV4Y543_CAEEX|nr:hypothetical protein CEXT_484471 [Caerostris extrusa]
MRTFRMVNRHVGLQASLPGESFATMRTTEGVVSYVSSHVGVQIAFLFEALHTNGALIGFLSSMDPDVLLHISRTAAGVLAERATAFARHRNLS